jgi:hypothetical protein
MMAGSVIISFETMAIGGQPSDGNPQAAEADPRIPSCAAEAGGRSDYSPSVPIAYAVSP